MHFPESLSTNYLWKILSMKVDNFIPKHFLPPIIRLCGKLEMLDRLLPKLKATNHRVWVYFPLHLK